jgi:hypothetical protein
MIDALDQNNRPLEIRVMCDLAYVNLLREKVRVSKAEEKRDEAFGKPPNKRFVPWVMPVSPPSQTEVEAKPAD